MTDPPEEEREFWASVEGELRKLVGNVVGEISGKDAKEQGLMPEHKRGKFVFLETLVDDVKQVFGKPKKDTTKVKKDKAA